MMSNEEFYKEVNSKERFEFGKNWRNFLTKLTDERIKISEISLLDFLGLENLNGMKFLDIGSGSGLSSLVAKRNGAKVTSFDFDVKSVWCTEELKSRYCPDNDDWKITQGSILDDKFVNSLGQYNIVYAWGVLHHTGDMFKAIDNAIQLVEKDGLIFLALYNDQGYKSKFWWMIKYIYNHLPIFFRKSFAYLFGFITILLMMIKYSLMLKPGKFIKSISNYQKYRGMSMLNDIIDWYGGFPYEYIKYQDLISYVEKKNFKLINGAEATSLGCHQVVLKKI